MARFNVRAYALVRVVLILPAHCTNSFPCQALDMCCFVKFFETISHEATKTD
jgi:hypothetical protein